MANYLGYLESGPFNSDLGNATQGTLTFTGVITGTGDLITPNYEGIIINDALTGGIVVNKNYKGFNPMDSDLVINTNLSETIQNQNMILTHVYYDIGTKSNNEFNGAVDYSLVGILNAQFFKGYLPSGNTTDIKIIYRTVGSPRRSPLDIAWTRSKDAEGYVIDEVDGDIDG